MQFLGLILISWNFLILFIYFSCKKATKDTPAVPEDAEELSYKEICTKDQLQEMTRVNNTWDIKYCPSPCEQNGDWLVSSKYFLIVSSLI